MANAKSANSAKPPKAAWSFLCYMAADNDLSPYGLKDIEELTAHGRPDDLYIGIELDTLGPRGSTRYEVSEPDFTGRGHRVVVGKLPEQDTGDFKTLRNFLDWGLQRTNAAEHFVVIWGHGMGSAVAPDFQSMGGSIRIPDLDDAFSQAGFRKKSNRPEPSWSNRDAGRIAILGFDACNMASLENVWALRKTTRVVIASQEKVPATGWPYQCLLEIRSSLASGTAAGRRRAGGAGRTDLMKIGKSVAASYVQSYKETGITAVTMSVVYIDGLAGIVSLANDLGRALAGTLTSKDRRTRKQAQDACADARLYVQGFHLGAYADLGHFCALLGDAPAFAGTRAGRLAGQLAAAISRSGSIHSAVGGEGRRKNAEVADATGLSVWFPAQRTRYMSERARYARENGAEFDGWRRFLDAYHG